MAQSREATAEAPAQGQIFVVNGEPVAFYLHGTNEPGDRWALTPGQREELARKVMAHGGRICPREEDADTIIAKEGKAFYKLEYKYSSSRKYVEKPTFVNTCIRNRRYAHEPIRQRSMGGRIPGETRVKFTSQDDRHLCEYIALRIPNKEAGGRYGEVFYKELVDDGWKNEHEFGWARRHTWHSWRERYRKNDARLDPIIDQIVAANPPPVDGKGLYEYSRLVNAKQHYEFMKKNQYQPSDEEEDYEDTDAEEQQENDELPGEEDAQRHPSPAQASVGRNAERRQTDFGPRRLPGPSSTKPPYGRRSAPGNMARPRHQDLDDTGEFQSTVGLDDDFDFPHDFDRPGPEEAGPSGTQHSPSPAPSPRASQPAKKPPTPRPVRPNAAARAASQFPMSSQMTLVNPTQPRSTAQRHRETPLHEDQEVDSRPQKRRRNIAKPFVLIDSERGRVQQQRSSYQAQVQQDQDHRPDEPADLESFSQSPPAGQTNEDAEVVEEMLDGSVEHSGRLSPDVPFELEELDSDDERALLSLNPQRNPPRSSASDAQTGPSRALSRARKRPLLDEQDEDLEDFAKTLDLVGGMAPPRAIGSVAPGPSASSRAQAQAPVTPSASRSLLRAPSVAESTSTSSSQQPRDPVNHVPLDGTRASAERRRARESARHEPYNPPPGTKAFEVAKQKSARRTRSGKIRG
ncbi:hypothetical protein BD311DRAFT_720911 [Dichomitus squalens]|uniref:Rap1 Myb domain-containing protein n=1 Tax=Dichomitus squalens TaxID=114155 RepID=A0A4Q9MP93_9APHY|nr:hypothetical protein BD311DRAFT_720911 [Dichomitus squalens]